MTAPGDGRREVYLRWVGLRSPVGTERTAARRSVGEIDEEDVWNAEKWRGDNGMAATPFRAERLMGPTNVYGVPNEERLERVYRFGPAPWDFIQAVLESDARQILRGPSRREFRLVRAGSLEEAQEEVWRELMVPIAETINDDDAILVVPMNTIGEMTSAEIRRAAVPISALDGFDPDARYGR